MGLQVKDLTPDSALLYKGKNCVHTDIASVLTDITAAALSDERSNRDPSDLNLDKA